MIKSTKVMVPNLLNAADHRGQSMCRGPLMKNNTPIWKNGLLFVEYIL
jgi:hypothetical protein